MGDRGGGGRIRLVSQLEPIESSLGPSVLQKKKRPKAPRTPNWTAARGWATDTRRPANRPRRTLGRRRLAANAPPSSASCRHGRRRRPGI